MLPAQQAIDEFLASPRLPSLPAIALEVVEIAQRADVDVNSIAEIIKQDPALASKILMTVNSSYYGQPRKIGTVQQATIILGLNTVRTLALGFSLIEGLGRTGNHEFDQGAFWQRNIRTAAAARLLADRIGSVDREEAYLAGLLCRLGVLAMSAVLGSPYADVYANGGGTYAKLLGAEQSAFGTIHTAVGERLAERWDLPAQVAAVMHHLALPEAAPETHQAIVRIVAAAESIADLFGDEPATALQTAHRRFKEWFDIEAAEVEQLANATDETVHSVSRLLELSTDDLPATSTILAQANEVLTQINLRVTQESARLYAENLALANDASTDSLTGLANRRRFQRFLEEQSGSTRQYGGQLALLMLDLDHFKQVNDTYGHPIGDRVLQNVASVLRELSREADLPARHGGEEFSIVMPATELTYACAVAENIRASIAAIELRSADGEPFGITASIGVAVLDGFQLEDQAALIERADAALYSAKQNGRDRVVASPLDRAA